MIKHEHAVKSPRLTAEKAQVWNDVQINVWSPAENREGGKIYLH